MTYEIRRQDELHGERRACVAASLVDAERAMLHHALREVDSLWLRDRRSVAVTFTGSAVVLVDLQRGRVVAQYALCALDYPYQNAREDELGVTDVLELVQPVPGRVWP